MKKKEHWKKKMQLLGRKPTSLGLIGHHRNLYATDTDAISNKIFTLYNKS